MQLWAAVLADVLNICRIANAMATTGQEWAEIIARNNSGTYNNQYMVIDLKLFSPGQELQPNLLWVIEQVRPPVIYSLPCIISHITCLYCTAT